MFAHTLGKVNCRRWGRLIVAIHTLPSSPSSKVRARAIRSTAPFSPMAGRKRSAVEQVLQYAVNLQIDWFLVTNMKEIRLFHKGHDLFTYERFETATLAGD